MVKLTREVRFSLTSDFKHEIASASAVNSWGGWPGGLVIAPFLALRVTVAGEPDPVTGMLCNISLIDRVVRTAGFRAIADMMTEANELHATSLLTKLAQVLQQEFAAAQTPASTTGSGGESPTGLVEFAADLQLTTVELRLTPTLKLEMNMQTPGRVLLTQQFEFSAAHRLQCDDYSDAENHRVFGKCNNPNGHGHNYVLDVTLTSTADKLRGRAINLEEFENIVRREVIDPYDHEHLNCEDDFAGMNPTVENIAMVIWRKLHGQFGEASLHRIRVYETSKTMAEYEGE
ncbi:MAG: 6-carboxytetrahydropterin synthase [Pirellulales bacterium]|nr:6-carboxytetrahydropterin synthase [Pirellulales bacterium]